ncbi:hypothetical protein DENSPDRAFT_2932 [Dentipellis sp. KUC8613]|nr:hypothetical protein DENSPDRAFT_2932 [Dentipellis sp. KUC8613]
MRVPVLNRQSDTLRLACDRFVWAWCRFLSLIFLSSFFSAAPLCFLCLTCHFPFSCLHVSAPPRIFGVCLCPAFSTDHRVVPLWHIGICITSRTSDCRKICDAPHAKGKSRARCELKRSRWAVAQGLI